MIFNSLYLTEMKKILITIILVVTSTFSHAQEIYWANKVDSISSEYSDEEAAAINILGVPNVDNRGRWSAYAWAIEPNRINTEGVETAYIDVSFGEPGKSVYASQLAIFESFNPGAISEILLFDFNEWHRVYIDTFVMAKSGFRTFDGKIDSNLKDTLASVKKDWNIFAKDKEFQRKKGYNILNVFFEPQEIVLLRIVLNPLTIDGWNQIDAVAISESSKAITYPKINLADRSLISERSSKNLGNAFNTPYSEINPIINPANKELYFSRSMYHTGYFAETQHIYVSNYAEKKMAECYKRKDIVYESKNIWTNSTPFINWSNNIIPNEIFSFSEDGNTMYLNNLYTKVNKDNSDSIFKKETHGISISKKDTTFWTKADSSELKKIKKLISENYKYIKINKDKNALLLVAQDTLTNDLNLYTNLKIREQWLSEPMFLGNLSERLNFLLNYNEVHFSFYADTSNIDSLKLGNIFWSKAEELKIQNFKNTSKYISVSLTPNEKIMLLAVENEKSIGKRDLFVSLKDKNGNWTEPQSLGNTVNTLNDEASPFLDDDGVTLYFSSAGHNGYGEMDIYVTRRLGSGWTQWTKPRNLGKIVNTGGEENHFVIDPNTQVAYFSSTTKAVGCNGMSDLYDVQMSKPIELIFAGKVLDVQTKNGISEAEVILMPLDDDGNEVFRSISLTTEKFTGKFQVKMNEFVDANKLSKFALITRKKNYKQTNNKGDSIVFDIADLDITKRQINIKRNLFMTTKHGDNANPNPIIDDDDNKGGGIDTIKEKTIYIGDTVIITKYEKIYLYDTIYLGEKKGIHGDIVIPNNTVHSCDVLFHRENLFLIPEIGPDSLIRIQLLKPAFKKEFDYNQINLDLSEIAFNEMIANLVAKQRKFKQQITVHIVASASRVPTKSYSSNQVLSEKRAKQAINRIKTALAKNNISEDLVNFQEHTFVQGPKYRNDHKTVNYKEFQYIKIWLVSCNKGN